MCNLNGKELKRLEKTLEEFKQAVAEEDYYKKTIRNFKKQLQIICKMLKST